MLFKKNILSWSSVERNIVAISDFLPVLLIFQALSLVFYLFVFYITRTSIVFHHQQLFLLTSLSYSLTRLLILFFVFS